MKKFIAHFTLGIIFLVVLSLFFMPVSAEKAVNSDLSVDDVTDLCDVKKTAEEKCLHTVMYQFDDATMMVNGVYEGNRVEPLLEDLAYYRLGDSGKIFKDGKEVTEGLLEAGMTVQVFHGNKLYGEYVISELLEPYPDVWNNNPEGMLKTLSSNSYGFILPIDKMLLGKTPEGNISRDFTSDRGIDIANGGVIPNIDGQPIRTVTSGKSIAVQSYNGSSPPGATGLETYGNYVKMDHGNGICTLYAHMKYTPSVTLYQNIEQGTILGFVGETGNAQGSHLHFEVWKNGVRVDPLPYLTGAPTYSGKNGWVKEGDNIYYYENGVTKKGWWHPAGSSTAFYFNPTSGIMATGFTKIGSYTYYFFPDGMWDGTRGQLLTGWQTINGKIYHFHPSGNWDGTRGRMSTGWLWLDDGRYLMGTDGVRITGWKAYPDSSEIYYFDPSNGRMKTGWWHPAGSSTAFYFDPSSGIMATGLTTIGNCKYYFFPDGMWDGTRGQLMTGWQEVDGKIRYFFPSGNWDGTRGQMLNGWQNISTQTNGSHVYYFEDGVLARGWRYIGGETYFFIPGAKTPVGNTSTNVGQQMRGWRNIDLNPINSGRYYFGANNGIMATGVCTIDGTVYIFETSGQSPALDRNSKKGQLIN